MLSEAIGSTSSTVSYHHTLIFFYLFICMFFYVKPSPPTGISGKHLTVVSKGSGVSDAQRQSWFDQMEREALSISPSAVVALSDVDRKTLKALATRHLEVEVGWGIMPRHGCHETLGFVFCLGGLVRML